MAVAKPSWACESLSVPSINGMKRLMDFSNTQLEITKLPSSESLILNALDPRFAGIRLKLILSFYFIIILILLISAVAFEALRSFALSYLGIGLLLSISILLGLIAWYFFAATQCIFFAVRQHDIVMKSGLFWRKQVVQPLQRVQHVEVTQGPVDRKYSLAKIQLFSAGTAVSTFRIPGLDVDLAEKIKQYVLDYQLLTKAGVDKTSLEQQCSESFSGVESMLQKNSEGELPPQLMSEGQSDS
ncbi:MAG: hypothetical protein COC19_07395 [SAR86 cluster bacterium]|uniref:YdbS-like PH domain-containing protein n=1 Tax=SAR86 cluster bacterium TaxID=2030880 RepID=A0A2A4MGS5_9GAMM|nr:MAG: hypothetical protein COC19_07395 [SAR86 cluster bacterium]